MLQRALLVALLSTLLAPGLAEAKARFMPRDELVEEAPIIALVEVTQIGDAEAQGRHFTYRQVCEAKTERVLKGELPARFQIHARKTFRCASTSYLPGRYLVFLRREGTLITTVNHHLGNFAIHEGSLKFFTDGATLDTGQQKLASVLETITGTLLGRRAAALLPAQHSDGTRTYARQSVSELTFPERARFFGGERIFKATYVHEPPRTGAVVRARRVLHRYVLFAKGQEPRVLEELDPTLRRLFLAGVVAKTAALRERVAALWIWLHDDYGEAELGKWWGKRRGTDAEAPGGHVHTAYWVHGKSCSWTDVFTFRYDAGRLVSLDHEEQQH